MKCKNTCKSEYFLPFQIFFCHDRITKIVMSSKRFFGFLLTTAVTPSWKLKESPNKSKSTFIWTLPVRGEGGVLTFARMVWGTYFTEGFLQGGFPETFILYRMLASMQTLYYSFSNHTTLQNVKIGPKNRCPRVPV